MTATMLQATLVKAGEIRVERVPVPTPGPGEVLIKVQRIGVCGSDATIFRGRHPYVKFPVIMGHEFAGEVAALGEGVHGPALGTRVTVIPHLVCGRCPACAREQYNFCESLRCTGAEADGAHREYIAMPARMVLPIPDQMSLDDAALVEPACVAYHAARRGAIKPGDQVLIVGAGPIGVYCLQSCRALGAARVVVADLDPGRLALARSLGADAVIEIGKENLEDGLRRTVGDPKEIDLFFDCVGEQGRVLDGIVGLARRGTRVVVVGVLQNGCQIAHLPDFVQHELTLLGTTMYVPQDYREMIALMGRGLVRSTGMISHRFPLSRIKEVFDLVDQRREPFFKIMLEVDA